MHKRSISMSLFPCFFLAVGLLAAPAAADEVILKNGSRIIGEVLSLEAGTLKVKTAFSKEIEIAWGEVAAITTEKPLPFVLKDDRYLGTASPGPPGQLSIKTQLAQPLVVGMDQILEINPPFRPAITFRGFVSLGAAITDGNTRTRSANANGEFEARAEKQRFTLRGAWNYAEDEDDLIARNARASAKYDYFITKRFYLFGAALFEGDEFQDLNLRTALSAGPGYQFIDIGDFDEEWLRELQLSGEVGISYVDEDYEEGIADQKFVAGRWQVKLNWPVVPKRVILFHVQEGYPSLERGEDLYITTEQGVRLSILAGFFAAFQINWRWDNTPAPGRERADTAYLVSVGYSFEAAR